MQINRDRFMEEGYLILRNFIEPEELHALRLGFDVLIQRAQERSRRQRTPEQPIGGAWQEQSQPVLEVPDFVCPETAFVADYYLRKPLGVSSELLESDRVGLGSMGMMVSAVWDRGCTDWHRDYSSNVLAPLTGVQRDMAVNGPPYVQWNIAAYDDDIFCVVPGSHVNPDSQELRESLLVDDRVPQPGSVQADLRAGDAIVYAAYIQHWGSYYSSRMRRVISMGYSDYDKVSSFRGRPHWRENLQWTESLSTGTRAWFEQQVGWAKESRDMNERLFRSALAKDEKVFLAELAAAHSEDSFRTVALVHFCRLAEKIQMVCGTGAYSGSEHQRREAEAVYGGDYWKDLKGRYRPEEADAVGCRFALMSDQMRADREASDAENTELYRKLTSRDSSSDGPNFESRSLRCHYHKMPDVTVEELIASW